MNFSFLLKVNDEVNKFSIMSNGNDVGSGENEIDSHSSMHPEPGDSSNNNNNNNNRDDEQMDGDNEAALNTNYDSSDGAVPVFRLAN